MLQKAWPTQLLLGERDTSIARQSRRSSPQSDLDACPTSEKVSPEAWLSRLRPPAQDAIAV
jgi:hypothetical protein